MTALRSLTSSAALAVGVLVLVVCLAVASLALAENHGGAHGLSDVVSTQTPGHAVATARTADGGGAFGMSAGGAARMAAAIRRSPRPRREVAPCAPTPSTGLPLRI